MAPTPPRSTDSTATVSRTVNLPAGMVLLMFENEKMRRRWTTIPVQVVKSDNHSLRMKLQDGSFLAINVHSKSSNKTQVTLQQEGLPSAKAVQRQRTFWMEQLEKLEQSVG